MPLSQIVSASIEDGAVAPVDLSSVAQYTGFKNKLINGAMNVWQRATSFSAPANLAYTADRWFSVWGTANRTVSRQAGFSGSQYCMRVARNSGTTDNSYSGVVQIIETNNLYDLQGQTVTLSFSARRGSNFSAASNALLVYLSSGTVADQGSAVYWSPGWTGATAPINTSVTLGTTEQTFSLQATIPANCLEINVAFQYLATGTAGANDYFEITNVQLEKGITATSFDYRPYGTELQLCQRYCYVIGGVTSASLANGSMYQTIAAYIPIPLPVQARVPPTGISVTGTYTLYANVTAYNVSSFAIGASSVSCCEIIGTVTGATGGQSTFLRVNTAGQIQFTGMEL